MSDEQEIALVRSVGDVIGYGRLMQLGQALWRDDLAKIGLSGGEFSIGPCVASMVPCLHSIKTKDGHCQICCGSGYVTRWIAENVR